MSALCRGELRREALGQQPALLCGGPSVGQARLGLLLLVAEGFEAEGLALLGLARVVEGSLELRPSCAQLAQLLIALALLAAPRPLLGAQEVQLRLQPLAGGLGLAQLVARSALRCARRGQPLLELGSRGGLPLGELGVGARSRGGAGPGLGQLLAQPRQLGALLLGQGLRGRLAASQLGEGLVPLASARGELFAQLAELGPAGRELGLEGLLGLAQPLQPLEPPRDLAQPLSPLDPQLVEGEVEPSALALGLAQALAERRSLGEERVPLGLEGRPLGRAQPAPGRRGGS